MDTKKFCYACWIGAMLCSTGVSGSVTRGIVLPPISGEQALLDSPLVFQKIDGQKTSNTSVYLEFMGKGFYSLNLDFRPRDRYAASIGFQYLDKTLFPNLMGYYFFGKKRRLEVGTGLSTINYTDDWETIALVVHGVLGYRYQKNKGLIFRIGFTPLVGFPFEEGKEVSFVPLGGISLGYSF